MTTRELADRVGISFEEMAELLAESRAMGVVMPTEHGWKMTPRAQKQYGAALLALSLPRDDASRPARHAGTADFEEAA